MSHETPDHVWKLIESIPFAVLVTHEHMDHVAGIDELRSFNFHQRRPMDIHANAATQEAIRRMYHYAFSELRYPGTPVLDLYDIDDAPFMAGGVEVIPLPVMHMNMPVLGFRIGGLAYITDAKTIGPETMERLKGVDVLVLNALRRTPHPSHLNLEEALEVAARVGARATYFTHISHLLGRHEEVSAELPVQVHLAFDGLVVPVAGSSA